MLLLLWILKLFINKFGLHYLSTCSLSKVWTPLRIRHSRNGHSARMVFFSSIRKSMSQITLIYAFKYYDISMTIHFPAILVKIELSILFVGNTSGRRCENSSRTMSVLVPFVVETNLGDIGLSVFLNHSQYRFSHGTRYQWILLKNYQTLMGIILFWSLWIAHLNNPYSFLLTRQSHLNDSQNFLSFTFFLNTEYPIMLHPIGVRNSYQHFFAP